MVCLNALNRPRGSHTLLTKVLYRDGLSFFLVCRYPVLIFSDLRSCASQQAVSGKLYIPSLSHFLTLRPFEALRVLNLVMSFQTDVRMLRSGTFV